MYDLSITDHFSSAHSLRGYQGPCEVMHGHTWKVRMTLVSGQLNDLGLVVDFREVKEKFGEFIAHLDHVNLNDIPAFRERNPSTENLAKYIYEEFAKQCSPYRVKEVTVWESENACVTYYE